MPNGKIFLIEDHHQALEVWRKLRIKEAALIHIDAHVDFGFYALNSKLETLQTARCLTDLKKKLERLLLYEKYGKDLEQQANPANYIYPAMRDGIVRSFDWIVPGSRTDFRDSLLYFKKILNGFSAQNPTQRNVPRFLHRGIRSKLLNKNFLITDLFSTSAKTVPVLLDIDVDFLLFNSAVSGVQDIYLERKPWMCPKEFVAFLKKKFPHAIVTTIAYSVNGRYTPLLYKFFGDEIAFRLKRSELGVELETIFTLRNRAIESYFKKDLKETFQYINQALGLLEKAVHLDKPFRKKFFAHLYWWSYDICWKINKKNEARSYYQKALKNDPTLRVEDNNQGRLYFKRQQFTLARAEFEKMIYCDPLDHHAIRGIGDINFSRKRYEEARKRYAEILGLRSNDKKALEMLAECHLCLGDMIGTSNILKKLRKLDPMNGRAYRIHAEISASEGQYEQSLAFYKKAAILGPDNLNMYKNIFRILKIKKNKPLSEFFRSRYQELLKNSKQKRCCLLIKKGKFCL